MFEPASAMPVAPSRSVAICRFLQVATLVGNLVLTTLALGGFPAETKSLTALLTVTAIVLALVERAFSNEPVFDQGGWLLVPFLAYTAVNVATVTSVPWLGWRDWTNWGQLIGVFWVSRHLARLRWARQTFIFTFVLLALVQVGLAAYQHFGVADWLMLGRKQAPQFTGRSSGSFGAPNSLGAFLVLVIPVTTALVARKNVGAVKRVWWSYVTLALGFALILTQSRGAWIALAVVALITPALFTRGSVLKRMGAVIMCGLFLAAVSWILGSIFPAGRERLVQLKVQSGELSRPIMWRAAWNMFRTHPLTGTGGGSYAVEFDHYRPESFQLEPRWAHNEYLNTLSDYGLIGISLGLGAVVVLVFRVGGTSTIAGAEFDRRVWRGIGAGLAAFSLQLGVDFSLRVPALALSFAILAGLWSGDRKIESSAGGARDRLYRWVAGLAAVGLVLATSFWILPAYRGEALRVHGRNKIDKLAANGQVMTEQDIRLAQEALASAAALAPSNASAWSDHAYATTLLAQFAPARARDLGRHAQISAERAIQLSARVAEFWMQLAVAYDLQGRWTEAGSALVEALKLAPSRADVWYQQAAHLERNPVEFERALAAADVSLRLDPGNAEAHALRRRLAERVGAP